MRLALLAALVISGTALADRREAYVLLEGGVGVQLLTDAATGSQSATAFGPAGAVQVFYGLTNTLHLGAYVRGAYLSSLSFAGVQPTLADGSTPTGTLYEDELAIGGGALLRLRIDTGVLVAPFAQLELGATWLHFSGLALYPPSHAFAIALPERDVLAPDARGVLGLELRLVEHLVLELRLGVRRALTPIVPWQFDGGLAVGAVW